MGTAERPSHPKSVARASSKMGLGHWPMSSGRSGGIWCVDRSSTIVREALSALNPSTSPLTAMSRVHGFG